MNRLMARLQLARDEGSNTIEYCMICVAAAGFGGVLYKVLSSPAVQEKLNDVVQRAFG
ncbi:DUF4244 domain-containing protein [Actinoplanes sp. N902-109]|uniref:DUF4244 domain-containing protein n=1 Tax=Actinoplanes sp. (strain N902-109) TaxID=649831 RepID=UPI0003295D9D|nr:DUF4244 domain-containing protein [Actinoplanes sp. N902-109]AGL13967.1 hypothetical protein L083_0457 [Actinoplanes sp. N902-109]